MAPRSLRRTASSGNIPAAFSRARSRATYRSAARQDRAYCQPEDSRGARPHRTAIDPRPRRRGHRVTRRELMLLLGGAMGVAGPARAQQKAMPVIGYLHYGSPGPFAPFMTAFHQGLSETGYDEGQNVAIEYRWAEGRY